MKLYDLEEMQRKEGAAMLWGFIGGLLTALLIVVVAWKP